MRVSEKKLRRLELIARMYYEGKLTQREIASQLGVSRPLISRLLQDARDLGLVEIRVYQDPQPWR